MLRDIYAEGGLSLTRAVMEDIFKIPVPYYISFTPSTFTRMIDMIGGFDLYVEKPMYHEHADGTGPFQKKWNEIPLFARIIHLADIIDIIRNSICIRPAKSRCTVKSLENTEFFAF